MTTSLIVLSGLLAVCNAFNERRPAQNVFQIDKQDANVNELNNEVQFVQVHVDDGKYILS